MLPTLCFSGILLTLLTGAQCAKQPHILFILADDYGWNDIGNEMLFLTTFFYFVFQQLFFQ